MKVDRIPAGDRAHWLSLRKQDVTASACAALLGAHEFMTPFALFALKAGTVDEDPEETPAMRRGRLLEPVAVALLAEEHPDWSITHNSGAAQVYLREASMRLGATPDVFVSDPDRGTGIVQVKSVEQSVFRQKWKTDDGTFEPPLWIVAQAIVEAKLAGAAWAAVAAIVVGHGIDLHLVDVPIHQRLFDRIASEVGTFWQRIETGDAPSPDFSRDASVLQQLYANPRLDPVDLTGDNRLIELLQTRADRKATISQATADLKPIEAEIITKLGAHERASVPGWRICRSLTHRKGYTVAPTSFRQLRITKTF